MRSVVPAGIYGEEARQLIVKNHPDLQGMSIGDVRFIEPPVPLVKGESRFLLLNNDYRYQAIEQWRNSPGRSKPIGGGHGFSAITETPIFLRENKPVGVPDIWNAPEYLRISKRALDLLNEFAEGVLEAIPISRIDKRGPISGEYYLVDVVRALPGIDWANSHLRVEAVKNHERADEFRIILTIANGFRLRPDITPDVHIFRDERNTSNVFVSHKLAKAIQSSGLTGVDFSDPAGLLAINPAISPAS